MTNVKRKDSVFVFINGLQNSKESGVTVGVSINEDGDITTYKVLMGADTLTYYTYSGLVNISRQIPNQKVVPIAMDVFYDTFLLKKTSSTLVSLKSAIESFMGEDLEHDWKMIPKES